MKRACVVSLLVALLAVDQSASGQVGASLDVGAATVRYADSVRHRATTIAPALRLERGALTSGATATVSLFDDTGWSGQGSVMISMSSPALGALRGELIADATGSTHQDGTRLGRYVGGGRLHISRESVGAWAGVAAGHMWDAASWRSVVEGEGGIWIRVAGAALLGTYTPVRIGDAIGYSDVEGLLLLERGRIDLALGAGIRSGDSVANASTDRWGTAAATVWLLPSVGVNAATGIAPADFTLGVPRTRYAAMSLRIAARRPVVPNRDRGTTGRTTPIASGAPPLEHQKVGEETVIRIHAPHARDVEIVGDVTAWTPLALRRQADGWWHATARVAPGAYQLNVRVNAGPWIVPSGIAATIDEYGIPVGIVVIR
jgi:hypothetical protein